MQPQQQQQEQKGNITHNFALDDDTYFAIKQLSSLKGHKHPAFLVREILKAYVQDHKSKLLPV